MPEPTRAHATWTPRVIQGGARSPAPRPRMAEIALTLVPDDYEPASPSSPPSHEALLAADLEDAIQTAWRAHHSGPGDLPALRVLACAFLARGDLGQALQAAGAVLSHDATDPLGLWVQDLATDARRHTPGWDRLPRLGEDHQPGLALALWASMSLPQPPSGFPAHHPTAWTWACTPRHCVHLDRDTLRDLEAYGAMLGAGEHRRAREHLLRVFPETLRAPLQRLYLVARRGRAEPADLDRSLVWLRGHGIEAEWVESARLAAQLVALRAGLAPLFDAHSLGAEDLELARAAVRHLLPHRPFAPGAVESALGRDASQVLEAMAGWTTQDRERVATDSRYARVLLRILLHGRGLGRFQERLLTELVPVALADPWEGVRTAWIGLARPRLEGATHREVGALVVLVDAVLAVLCRGGSRGRQET